MPCHGVSGQGHVCSGEGGRHQRSACGCIREPMTWRDLVLLWYGNKYGGAHGSSEGPWPWPCMVRLAVLYCMCDACSVSWSNVMGAARHIVGTNSTLNLGWELSLAL